MSYPSYKDSLINAKVTGVTSTDFSFTHTITIGADMEVALIHASPVGLQTKRYTQFYIDVTNLPMDNDRIYTHSGEWSNTKDNVCVPAMPIYHKLTNSIFYRFSD